MAPGGPWLSIRASFAPNGATATHLVAFLIFGSFLIQTRLFLRCTETQCVLHRDTVGRPAGGGWIDLVEHQSVPRRRVNGDEHAEHRGGRGGEDSVRCVLHGASDRGTKIFRDGDEWVQSSDAVSGSSSSSRLTRRTSSSSGSGDLIGDSREACRSRSCFVAGSTRLSSEPIALL